tara:strand:+ start:270 stop:704 length:435 start_codon:yes stop_codon:yes gene_type:complete
MNIKKLFFIASVVFSAKSFSSEMLPLTQYMTNNDMNDPVSLEYVAKRCSAYSLVMLRWSREGEPLYTLAQKNYQFWYVLAVTARKSKYPEENGMYNITKSVANMMEKVDQIMIQNQDLTGSTIMGTFLEDDMALCGKLLEAMNE